MSAPGQAAPVSVVIPTLDAAASLPAALDSLREGTAAGLVREVMVSDGGSKDGTLGIARQRDCRAVTGGRGRGGQLARGAEAAGGEWLLFLHADTRLAAGWSEEVRAWLARPGAPGRAAVFAFALDDPSWKARLLERLVAARVAALALPYGDQGLLISRRLYDALGGFRPLPLMEDVDLVRRIGRARLTRFATPAVTSAARYLRDGYGRRMSRNALCLGLYLAGVPPARIVRLYG